MRAGILFDGLEDYIHVRFIVGEDRNVPLDPSRILGYQAYFANRTAVLGDEIQEACQHTGPLFVLAADGAHDPLRPGHISSSESIAIRVDCSSYRRCGIDR